MLREKAKEEREEGKAGRGGEERGQIVPVICLTKKSAGFFFRLLTSDHHHTTNHLYSKSALEMHALIIIPTNTLRYSIQVR